MAQKLFKNSFPYYSKNFYNIGNRFLLKSRPIIYNPIVQLKKSSYSSQSEKEKESNEIDVMKLTQTIPASYVNECYNSGGSILRDFINEIEIIIYENIKKFTCHPIELQFYHDNTVRGTYQERFGKFSFNGRHIALMFGADIEKYLKTYFPDLKFTCWSDRGSTYTIVEIKGYMNRDVILKIIQNQNQNQVNK